MYFYLLFYKACFPSRPGRKTAGEYRKMEYNCPMRVKEPFRRETIINKSRFIACLSPARSEEEARAFIASIRKEFPDSTHVCTAFVIGENMEIQRSSDNGEPSGTAGVPMLEAIRRSGCTDTAAAVVRYFGGIKLGTGGLARAYGGTVSDALKEAPKTKTIPCAVYSVRYPYDLSGTMESFLRRNCEILDISYDEEVTCRFRSVEKNIPETIRDLSRGAVAAVFEKDDVMEQDV